MLSAFPGKTSLILATWLFISLAQCTESNDASKALDINILDDGPTTDLSAGLGIEFESGSLSLHSDTWAKSTTPSAKVKGQVLGERKGTNWALTVDTTATKGTVNAEYILDGTKIKVEAGMAATAAKQVAADLTTWNPSKDSEAMSAAGFKDWKIPSSFSSKPANIEWAAQATAPLPLEAINDLFRLGVTNPMTNRPALLGSQVSNMVYVNSQFFKSKPLGIAVVGEDVMGFLSLILTYAKSASKMGSGSSAKSLSSIMPRTDFLTMYKSIESDIKASITKSGDLYTLIKTLACYQNYYDDGYMDTIIDAAFCDIKKSTLENPIPNASMDTATFNYVYKDGSKGTLTVKDWINGLQTPGIHDTDLLTSLDKVRYEQVGGLGPKMEYVLGTKRLVPLFEFRDLYSCTAAGMKSKVEGLENAIIAYHKKYATAPKSTRKRDFRQRRGLAKL